MSYRENFELFKKELFSGLKTGITAWSARVASRLNQNTPISRSRGTFGVQPFKQEGSTLKGGIGTSFSEPGALYAFELGRCFTAEVKILTNPDGPKSVLELQQGDMILCYDEVSNSVTKAPITAVLNQGKQAVFGLKTRNRFIKVTGNHPFLALSKKKVWNQKRITGLGRNHIQFGWKLDYIRKQKMNEWGLEWKELMDLKVGDFIIALDHLSNINQTISMRQARLLGFYVGDGYARVRYGEGGSFQLFCSSPEEAMTYSSLLQEEFDLEPHIKSRKGCWIVNLSRLEVANFFLQYCPGHALTKRVPHVIWAQKREVQIEFLRGYVEADGHEMVYKNGNRSWTLASPNQILIEDLHVLAMQAGLKVSNLYKQWKREGYKESWCHIFSVYPGTPNQWLYPRFKFNLSLPSELHIERVQSLRYEGEEETYDIEVEGFHNFLANGLLLHNSGGRKIHPTSTGGVFAVPLEDLKIPKFLGPGALGPGTPQRNQEINIPVAKRSEQKIFFRSYTLGSMVARPFVVPTIRALKRKVVEDLRKAVKVTLRGVR